MTELALHTMADLMMIGILAAMAATFMFVILTNWE